MCTAAASTLFLKQRKILIHDQSKAMLSLKSRPYESHNSRNGCWVVNDAPQLIYVEAEGPGWKQRTLVIDAAVAYWLETGLSQPN